MLGLYHPHILTAMSNVVDLLKKQGKYDKAVTLFVFAFISVCLVVVSYDIRLND